MRIPLGNCRPIKAATAYDHRHILGHIVTDKLERGGHFKQLLNPWTKVQIWNLFFTIYFNLIWHDSLWFKSPLASSCSKSNARSNALILLNYIQNCTKDPLTIKDVNKDQLLRIPYIRVICDYPDNCKFENRRQNCLQNGKGPAPGPGHVHHQVGVGDPRGTVLRHNGQEMSLRNAV